MMNEHSNSLNSKVTQLKLDWHSITLLDQSRANTVCELKIGQVCQTGQPLLYF